MAAMYSLLCSKDWCAVFRVSTLNEIILPDYWTGFSSPKLPFWHWHFICIWMYYHGRFIHLSHPLTNCSLGFLRPSTIFPNTVAEPCKLHKLPYSLKSILNVLPFALDLTEINYLPRTIPLVSASWASLRSVLPTLVALRRFLYQAF